MVENPPEFEDGIPKLLKSTFPVVVVFVVVVVVFCCALSSLKELKPIPPEDAPLPIFSVFVKVVVVVVFCCPPSNPKDFKSIPPFEDPELISIPN